MEDKICGQVIGGEINSMLIRERPGKNIELGDLLVIGSGQEKTLLQVFNIVYGSQLSQQVREQISGFEMSELKDSIHFFDSELRKYILAEAQPILNIKGIATSKPKLLPDLFSLTRHIEEQDFEFLKNELDDPVYLGNIRSGSKTLDVPLELSASEIISHHILVCATTGRGKSNLIKNMVWNCIGNGKVGLLILDAHNEYYGVKGFGLKDHDRSESVKYYSTSTLLGGTYSLIIDTQLIRIEHLNGIIDFSDVQYQIMEDYFRSFGENWLSELILTDPNNLDEHMRNNARTIRVLQRKFRTKLSLFAENNQISTRNPVFRHNRGRTVLTSILNSLEKGEIVIIDTSRIGESTELLIGSIISHEIKNRHEEANSRGTLDEKLPIGIIIEEAPRVLNKENRDNIYSTIAREGRKFKIGLIAISQLVSIIPNDILANINTKIILGNEMINERRTLIQNASQDISKEEKTIGSLDKGEAIVTSIFTRFAVPIKIPLFETTYGKITRNIPREKLSHNE